MSGHKRLTEGPNTTNMIIKSFLERSLFFLVLTAAYAIAQSLVQASYQMLKSDLTFPPLQPSLPLLLKVAQSAAY